MRLRPFVTAPGTSARKVENALTALLFTIVGFIVFTHHLWQTPRRLVVVVAHPQFVEGGVTEAQALCAQAFSYFSIDQPKVAPLIGAEELQKAGLKFHSVVSIDLDPDLEPSDLFSNQSPLSEDWITVIQVPNGELSEIYLHLGEALGLDAVGPQTRVGYDTGGFQVLEDGVVVAWASKVPE